jgi:hypothetical protein
MTKQFSSNTRNIASDYDNINGLEQKEAMMDKGIEEVNNNWSIDDGNNSGNNSNKNAITIDLTCHCNSGEGDAFERSPIVVDFFRIRLDLPGISKEA